MYAILLMLAAVMPPPMPDLPPVVDLDPNPPAMCVVCKGTQMIKQGSGNDVPCPECTTQLAMADTKKHGCDCESGGPCTCNGDCDCAECACENCPGKTSKSITQKVCTTSGCQMVTRTARKVNGHWWWQYGDRSWYGGTGKQPKLREVEEWPNGKWRYKGARRIVSEPLNVQIGRLGSPALSRAPGQHSHRCGMCGDTWSHYPGQSHRCPSCGGLSSQNYVQINSGRTYQRPVIRQPRRMFASRGG